MIKKLKKYIRIIAMLVIYYCFLAVVPVYAALTLDQGYASDKPYASMFPEDAEEIRNFMDGWENAIIRDIGSGHGVLNTKILGHVDRARMFWNNKEYYLWVQQYEFINSVSEKNNEKQSGRANYGVCELFIHNEKMNKVTSFTLNLPDAGLSNWCGSIYGLGAAKVMDGILITVGYYSDNTKIIKKSDLNEKNEKKMTVLLRLNKEKGKIFITQDDRCLGNPNNIENILAARKALQKCAGK